MPMSLLRTMSQLGFTSVLGILCSILTMLVIVYEFFFNSAVVPSFDVKLQEVVYFKFSWASTIQTVPFIVYLYMYQGILP